MLDSRPRRRHALFEEFKEFAMRGSVLDMAVGIIIGRAFTAIALDATRCPACSSEVPAAA